MTAAGYYTLYEPGNDSLTAGNVVEGDDEVYILAYPHRYSVDMVFGPNSVFQVLAGPYDLPEWTPRHAR